MNLVNLSEDIKNIKSGEEAVAVARKVLLQNNFDPDLECSFVKYLTGKARKAFSIKTEGWLVSFDFPVPEGSSPDCMFVELYPHLGKFHIPQIL